MNPNLEIAINNRVLNAILSRGWKDYDNFSLLLSRKIVEQTPDSLEALTRVSKSIKSSFFTLNHITPEVFSKALPFEEMIALYLVNRESEPLTFMDVFSEINNVNLYEAKKDTIKLATLPESVSQEALVDSLREKNATNCRSRTKDTVLEVADLEHFALKVKGMSRTFAAVVKGYKSIRGKSVTWEDIAHQIVKAYNRTNPDHILLVLAKNPSDSLISEFIQYGKSIGKPNLVILCEPVCLAMFLKARHII